MIKAAKCSGRDSDRSSLPSKIYENCRAHAVSELQALEPRLFLAQGVRAKEVVRKEATEFKWK